MKLFGAYAPTKIDMDIKEQEAKILITPEIIERLERYNRQRAELEKMKEENPQMLTSFDFWGEELSRRRCFELYYTKL